MSNLLASAKENLSFLLVCLGVFAALVLIALGAGWEGATPPGRAPGLRAAAGHPRGRLACE